MPAPQVGVITVKTQPVTVSTELTGRTTATTISEVRPQVSGIILARLFKQGSLVKAGQQLYQIDPRLYKASLQTAQAQLENARAQLYSAQAKARRYKTLSDTQAVSAQDIDDTIAAARQAQAAVNEAQAAVNTAKVNLGFTHVYAPITGRIGRTDVTKGALVSASQTDPLATIQQLNPIYVDITQSSTQLLKLRQALANGSLLPAKATVTLKLEDGTDFPQKGTVEFSEVDVDPDAGTVTIRASFPNPDGLLLPGMFVRVETPQGLVPNGILVPQQGISRDPKGDATAMVVNADNKVEVRQVTTDKAVGNQWLITKGLKAGDRLIVQGTGKIRPGMTVKPVQAKLDY